MSNIKEIIKKLEFAIEELKKEILDKEKVLEDLKKEYERLTEENNSKAD